MEIFVDKIKLKGNKYLEENGLPKFREKIQNRKLTDGGLLESELELYGYQIGDRFLPYLVQDLYSREVKDIELKTIVLENEHLKATFLPDYGMRLYSLYSKDEKRELLYVNPKLQFANLAILNAWFSGGIEWNIGQLGHTFSTCSPMYGALCKDENGNEFLKTYEYERCKGLYWSIDFYLKGNQLHAYVKMINPKDESIPSYWWTNIAVEENKNARVFSGNKNVIYINPIKDEESGLEKGMAHGELPYLPAVEGKDLSYPENYDFASEYFFQGEEVKEETWEAVVYNDGTMFYERSTENLRYRKMFCWGHHKGGKNWRDFLSTKGEGDYLEIQGGLSKTQVHGMDMPAKAQWDFVQIFGGATIDYNIADKEWEESSKNVYKKVNEEVNADILDDLLEEYRTNSVIKPTEILHMGNGFGAVEFARDPLVVPSEMIFPKESITEKEMPWLKLIETQTMDDIDICETPKSYMVDLRFEDYLIKASEKGSYQAYNHLGVMYLENVMEEKALVAFEKSNAILENPLAYRNLSSLNRDNEKAIMYMEKAIKLLGDKVKREFIEEYTELLSKQKEYDKLWAYYNTLSEEFKQSERIVLNVLPVAVKAQNIEFLNKVYTREFSAIREGERGYTEGYFHYQAINESIEKNIPFSNDLVEKYIKLDDIPQKFDFRLSKS